MAEYSAMFPSLYPTATAVNTPTDVTRTPDPVTRTPQTGTATDAAQGTTTVYHSATSAAKSGVPLGAIIGAVVGGVVTLVIIGALILCCRRRRKEMTERDFFIDDDHQPIHQVEPLPINVLDIPPALDILLVLAPSTAAFELGSQSKMSLNPVPMVPPVVEHALDGGALPPPPPAKEILPPMYDPSWSGPGSQ
ncbi:hypothetical protein CcaverHIS002_0602050 [Cutaneotrichosporon cavernicola]|nr:hypothetical protein CcaverHIS002_0602050 [Cutaneotrichosporon cavernicola]